MGSERRFALVAAAIGALSTVVFAWMLTLGRWDLLAEREFSNFFDLQARAMLDGHLDVAPGSLAFEGFAVDGRTYTYFGVFPSLLRMPVVALTDGLDGRLTTLSMLLAFVVAFASSALLVQRVKELVTPDRPWTTTGLGVAGLGLAAVGLSSNLTFLAGGAWVYNEAALWGCAGVLGAFAVLAGYLRAPRPSRLAWAAAWTAVAWLSRGSMGLAPTCALGATAVGQILGWRHLQRFTPPPPARGTPRRAGVILLLAALVPMGAFAATNLAKFGTPFSVPFSSQVGNDAVPTRNDVLDEYGGLFSLRLVPSATWQTIRPDLVSPSGRWPFLDFTDRAPIDVGDPLWDNVEPSAGALVTMPLLVALGAAGVVAALRSRARGPTGGLVALAPAAVGAAITAAVPMSIAFIAQRYITDLVPLLVLTAAAGIAAGDHRAASPARAAPGRRRAVVAGAAVLLVLGSWVTLSVTWLHQRFEAPPDDVATAAGLRAQDDVAEWLSTPAVPVERRSDLPPEPIRGTNVVVGDCDGLYRGDGTSWRPLEVTSARGRIHLRVKWDTSGATPASTLVTLGEGRDQLVVTIRRVDDRRIAVGLLRDGTDVAVARSAASVPAGREHEVVVDADPARAGVGVRVDGTGAAFSYGVGPEVATTTLGQDGAASAGLSPLPAAVTLVEDPTPTCDALTDGDP